eukprot:16450072-Heterocapsa_arctica.AAC.1
MKAERKYISGFGAVRLSKTEAIEVVSSKVRPQNLFVHITGYIETIRSEKFTRLGYLFFRDYGNERYRNYLTKITKEAYTKGELSKDDAFYINRLCNVNKGDILEAIMGYAWIYDKTEWPFLDNFP